MAKKKIAETSEEVKVAPEVAPAVEEVEKKTEEVKAPAKEAITETTVKMEELPDHAKAAFRLYPDVEALYIDTKGGLFPADAKPSIVGSAILYKNPNYKSQKQ